MQPVAAARHRAGHDRHPEATLCEVGERLRGAGLERDTRGDARLGARGVGDLNTFRRRDYVYALQWPGDSPLRPSYERIRDDPNWTTHELDGAHNLMRDNPDDLLRILLDVAGGPG